MSMELGGLQWFVTTILIGSYKNVGSSKSLSILIKQLEHIILDVSISLFIVFLLLSFIPTLLIVLRISLS